MKLTNGYFQGLIPLRLTFLVKCTILPFYRFYFIITLSLVKFRGRKENNGTSNDILIGPPKNIYIMHLCETSNESDVNLIYVIFYKSWSFSFIHHPVKFRPNHRTH